MANQVLTQIDSQELQKFIEKAILKAFNELNRIPDSKQLFTIKEASEYLNLAVQTIYSYTSEKTIPFFKKGKRLYFNKAALDAWLTSGSKT